MVSLVINTVIFVLHMTGGNVHFATKDGLDACFLRLLIKFDRAVKIDVIRECNGVHFKLRRTLYQLVYLRQTIEQTIGAVDMEMREFHLLIVTRTTLSCNDIMTEIIWRNFLCGVMF